MTGPKPPVPALGRAALERVLARAAELQAATGGDDWSGFTEEQLLELGQEVGLPAEHLRQALAEERSRVDLPNESGVYASLLGTATIGAARTVTGRAPAILGRMDEWMQRSESMQVKRQFAGQLTWEPRRDFATSIRRALRLGGRDQLSIAGDVHATVAEVDGARSHVRVVATLDGTRGVRAGGALAVGALGLLVGIPMFWFSLVNAFTLGAIVALVPAVALPMVAIAIARAQYHKVRARAQVALEQALDQLEFGKERPASVGEQLIQALVGKPRQLK